MSVTIAVCANFEPEARLVLAEDEREAGDAAESPGAGRHRRGVGPVTLVTFPAACGRPPLEPDALTALGRRGAGGRVELLGGACGARLPDTSDPCAVHRLRQCFDLVAPPALVDHYLQSGAYLVTSGWLAHWRARVAQLGIDEAVAPLLFGESMNRVVLLDTGVDPSARERLAELSAFVGLPAEVVPIGLEHHRLYLAALVAERRLELERAQSLASQSLARRHVANYAAAFDLVGTLAEITVESEAIQRALDVFEMLFAPARSTFLAIVGGAPAHAVTWPPRELDAAALHARLLDRGGAPAVFADGFLLPVRHAGELLGIVEVEGVASPDHLERDSALAVTVAGVSGLAIRNARQYETIQLAEQALSASYERLEVTLRSIGDGVIATDTAGCVTTLNQVAEALTGFSQAEAHGRPLGEVFRIVNELTGAVAADPVRKALALGKVVGLESHTGLIARDGTVRSIADSAAPIRGHDGAIRGVVLVFRDVTAMRDADLARAHAEESMRASEARLRLLSKTAGRLLAAEDPHLLANELCGEVMSHLDCHVFFNFLVDEAAGRLRLNAFAGIPDDEARELEWLDFGVAVSGSVARDRQRIVAEHVQEASDERTALARSFGLQAYCCHPLMARGRLIGTLSFGTRTRPSFTAEDVDTMRAVSVQVATALERMGQQRALRAANAQLLEADRHKDEFLAMLSHELRNPLAPILNSVYVLSRASGPEQAARARDVIERQARHMARMVDDLLDVTRISRGKVHLQRERVELGATVRGIGEDQRDVFLRQGKELSFSVPTEPLVVNGDPTRLAQMIGNLLQNAAKFTQAGGRTVLTLSREGDARAIIAVSDDGVGIQSELLPRIFELFVQADRTLDRSRGGLGLGLALVKGLAELHGGSVSAASGGPGKGARFTIRLPLESVRRISPMPSSSVPGGGARRVLVIEDNADAAESLKEALGCDGHVVLVASDGARGLAEAGAFAPDAVICDIGLPELDGYGVARAIRADPALRAIFLVALSGYAAPEDVARSAEAGFDRHIAKPPDLAALATLLASVPRRTPPAAC